MNFTFIIIIIILERFRPEIDFVEVLWKFSGPIFFHNSRNSKLQLFLTLVIL